MPSKTDTNTISKKRTRTSSPKFTPVEQEQLKSGINNPVQSMRALVKGSLFYFIQYFWDTYCQDPFVPNWHIQYICAELEVIARRVAARQRKLYDLVINVPPGTTKTATVSIFFPVWCWVNWHYLRFITTSHNKVLSLESAEYSRDIIRSDKFRSMFPDLDIKQDKDVKSNFRVVRKEYTKPGFAPRIIQGGGRVSTSVDAKIIGFHADIIIPDDLIDPKRALSDVSLPDVNDYLDKTLSTRKVNKAVSTMVMIMQRLHEDDPTGHILTKKKAKDRIRHLCFPGEIRTPGYEKQVKPNECIKFYRDGLMDTVRLDPAVLDEMLDDLGQYGYAGQVGQKPTPPGGGMFKPGNMPIIESLSSETNVVDRVRYWDKAATPGAGAFTAGVCMWRLQNGKFIIVDVVRGQWGTDDREDRIRHTAEADGSRTRVGIEQEPGSSGKDSADATIRNLAGYISKADRPTGDKIHRADTFSVQVNKGNVIMMRAEWNSAFKKELEFFPNSSYKDQVDAASGAFRMLTKKKQAKSL